jgi:hypothetical protein
VKPECWAAELALVADPELLPWALLVLGVVLVLVALALLPAPRGGDNSGLFDAEDEARNSYVWWRPRHRRQRQASKPQGGSSPSATGIYRPGRFRPSA